MKTKTFIIVLFTIIFFTLSACGSSASSVPEVTQESVKDLSIDTLKNGVAVKKADAAEAQNKAENNQTQESMALFMAEVKQYELYRDELDRRYNELGNTALGVAGVKYLCNPRLHICSSNFNKMSGRLKHLGEILMERDYTMEKVQSGDEDLVAFVKAYKENKGWRNEDWLAKNE